MSAKLIYKMMCPECRHVSYRGMDEGGRCEQPCCAHAKGGRPALCRWVETGEVIRFLLLHLQDNAHGVSFVPASWDYPACPYCSGSELVQVRTETGLTRVMCHNAFSRSGCSYIAPSRKVAA